VETTSRLLIENTILSCGTVRLSAKQFLRLQSVGNLQSRPQAGTITVDRGVELPIKLERQAVELIDLS
jgi:hypothetical protein